MDEDASVKQSGLIIDTPGSSLNNPKSNYDLLAHIISELSINLVLVLGSERLYNDLSRRYSSPSQRNAGSSDDAVTVLRVAPSPGAVARDGSFMKATRAAQTRRYFFGDARTPLNPHSQMWDFADLAVYRAVDHSAGSNGASLNFLPGMDEDDDYDPSAAAAGSAAAASNGGGRGRDGELFERVAPSQAMVRSVLAIKFAPGNAGQEAVRDSCVMGYVYVADVDEAKKKVRFLAPHPSRWGDRALVWSSWPESVVDLMS